MPGPLQNLGNRRVADAILAAQIDLLEPGEIGFESYVLSKIKDCHS